MSCNVGQRLLRHPEQDGLVFLGQALCRPGKGEVDGDAGITLPPLDTDGVTAALRRIVTDPDLAATMAAKGRERARLFSWTNTARQTLEVYRQAGRT